LIEKYEDGLKEQKISTGVRLYEKNTSITMGILIGILVLSLIVFEVMLAIGTSDVDNTVGNVSKNIENAQSTEVESFIDEIDVEKQQAEMANESNKKDWPYISIAIVALASAGLTIIALFSVDHFAMKNASKRIETNLRQRFKVLSDAIYTMYYKEADEKNINMREERGVDITKTKELIQIYTDEVANIKEVEKHRNAMVIALFSGGWTLINTVISEINKNSVIEIDWIKTIGSFLVIAFLGVFPVYFYNEINPVREKYQSMLNILKQYLVYSIEDDKSAHEEKLSNSEKKLLELDKKMNSKNNMNKKSNIESLRSSK
jgi:hypothetical protein